MVSAAAHWSTAVVRVFIRASTASADHVLSLTVDALELMASWSADIVGAALSWLRNTSYSSPSQPTYSCEPVIAVAWPCQRSMISSEAMLQPS